MAFEFSAFVYTPQVVHEARKSNCRNIQIPFVRVDTKHRSRTGRTTVEQEEILPSFLPKVAGGVMDGRTESVGNWILGRLWSRRLLKPPPHQRPVKRPKENSRKLLFLKGCTTVIFKAGANNLKFSYWLRKLLQGQRLSSNSHA